MLIKAYKYETIKLRNVILDADDAPADLTGAICMFSLTKPDGVIIEREAWVEANVLSMTVMPTELDLEGVYIYEFKVRLDKGDGGVEDHTTEQGKIVVVWSNLRL